MDGDSPWPVWPVARCGKGRLYRSYLKLSDHCRGYGELDEKSHVWMAPGSQGKSC